MKKTAGEPAFSVKSRFPVPPANSDRLAENPIDGSRRSLPAVRGMHTVMDLLGRRSPPEMEGLHKCSTLAVSHLGVFGKGRENHFLQKGVFRRIPTLLPAVRTAVSLTANSLRRIPGTD